MKNWLRLALLTPALALMAALAGAAPVAAAILPGVAVDGPSNLIDSVRPDVDVAPDNSAALVYLKQDGGVNHPFVSRFTGGVWGAPQRVDTGSGVAASNAHIAVANGGKVVVAYLRGGDAVARISAAPGAPFGTERIIQAGAGNVDVDLSPGGHGYAVVEASTDILAERLEGETWSEVGIGALNVDETQEAGSGNRLVRVAASADGTGGAIAWGEEIGGSMDDVEVYVRRLTGSTPGNALGTRLPPGSLPNSNAASGKVADQPAVDMDGTGTIWVVYRQNFEYGMSIRHRAIARPITGETVGAGQVVDNMGDAPAEGRDFQQVDVNGAGQGLLSHYDNVPPSDLEWASLAGGTWTRNGLVNPSDNDAGAPLGIPAIGENGSGLIAYTFKAGTGDNTAKGRPTLGGLGAEVELSNPAFGAMVSSLDASAGSGAFAAAAFVQQVGLDATTRRLVAAVVDLPQPVVNPPPPPPDIAPDVTGLALSRALFRLGSELPSVAAVKTGTTIRFTISEAATVRLRFRRAAPGRRVGGRCRKPTRLNRSRRRCTRMLSVRGSVSLPVQAGARRIKFAGRLSARRRLRPGRYQLVLTARDAAGNVSSPDRVRFRLLPRRRR